MTHTSANPLSIEEASAVTKPVKASDRVAMGIMDAIGDGTWKPGDRLPPERELMTRFGVGRSAVREAIASLASRGTLLVRHGHRPVIQDQEYETALSTFGSVVLGMMNERNGIENLFNMRVFMEAALVRHAARHATPRDIAELSEALERNRAAISNPEAFYLTDIAFHRVLYGIPGNPILPTIHKLYVEWLYRHWIKMPRNPEINRMNHAAHAGIYNAIVKRDPDLAENLLQSHLTAAWQFVRVTFEDSCDGDPPNQASGNW